MVKSEPTALAAGLTGATSAASTPAASAVGSHDVRFSPSQLAASDHRGSDDWSSYPGRSDTPSICEVCSQQSPLACRKLFTAFDVNAMNYDDDPDTVFETQKPRMSWPVRVLWLLAFFGLGGYGVYIKDYVIAAIPIVVMVSAFSGFRIGLLRLAGTIGAIALAVAYAPTLGVTYEVHFAQWFGTTGLTNRFASIGAVGILISLVITIAFIMITGRFVSKRPRLAWLNSWTGFLFAGAEGAVAALLLLGGILMIEPSEQASVDSGIERTAKGKIVSDAVLTIAKHTHQSRLGPLIEEYNPFVRIPELNKLDQVQQTVRVLNDPTKMNNLLNHPQVEQLKERPETKRAVRELLEDPQIREILSSKSSMDKSTAMTLLNHPAILNLIDQPGFVDAAMKIISKPAGSSIGHITTNPMLP